MKDIKKIEFVNTPPEVTEKEKEANKIAEKEVEIQPVIKAEIEEVLDTRTPEQKLVTKLWITVGILIGIFFIQYGIFPITRAFKYTQENKDNTDEVTILKLWSDEQTVQAKEERKMILCSKVKGETEYCKDAKPLPTLTPTPVLKVIYPTQAP